MKKGRAPLLLLLLFGASLGVRWIAMVQNYVVANDAVLYIKSAQLYSEGAYAEGFNAFPRSILPLFIALVQRLVGDWEQAGQWVSVLFGALAVIPLYLLAKHLFNPKVALLTGIFYTICPSLVKDSAEVLRDIPFVFFFITALWLGYKGIKEGRVVIMAISGFFILLSASLKDYGLALFAAVLLFLIWCILRHGTTWRRALTLATFFIVSTVLVIGAFWILSSQRGFNVHAPVITRAKTVLMGIKDQEERNSKIENKIESSRFNPQEKRLFNLSVEHRFVLYFYHIFYKMMHALNILFVFLILGMIKRHAIKFRTDEFILFSIYATYIPVFLLHLNMYNFLQTKNTFPLIVPSLIWSGVGFEELKEKVGRWMQNRNFPLKELVLRWSSHLMVLLICIPLLFMAWAPQRKDKLELKEIGLWLKNNGYAHSIILGEDHYFRLAFYADSEFISIPIGNYEDILKFAEKKRANLIVLGKKTISSRSPKFLDRISSEHLQPINITGIETVKYGTLVLRVIDRK